MYMAPVGVGAAMAYTIGKNGVGVLFGLAKLVAALYGALFIFVVVVLGASAIIARVPLGAFWRAVQEPFVIAFSTASSEAALPLALENMERFGAPQHIVAFVLPTGYSFNLTGSTLYMSLAGIFIAQAAGMNMPLSQQLLMMLTLMLTSKGAAGVPRSSVVILAGTITMFGLPAAGISLLLGADAVLDMARTAVNVLGNCMATAVVARWEGVDLRPAENRQFQVETL
jgi:proton glutamate symport protein